MSYEVPEIEPAAFTVGDTLQFRKSFADYKASEGWALSYQLRNAAAAISINASTYNVHDFEVLVAASATASYTAGTYAWAAYVTKASERHEVGRGTMVLQPNLAAAGAADRRSHVKKVLDAIEAVVEGRATKDQQEYAIAGRSLVRTPIADLLKLRDRYKAEYASELAGERINLGLRGRKRILTRFA